ncbi:hypothetical protein AN958_05675 [Leucoagaricus sp. SymC.cos]|nr:hypothetical protein AN958_05675 [Leucoagaricus sp. SymC.cos]
MAVFVRFFRLAMLFFNVYDSYKVLKLPPPSVQNKGRPSLRAMSQRKRDMKGCLAVWIVWSCFITYERFAEAVISLFIPFYDEFKSLLMLFLIMTRARGAEPIYLHIIRPFLKPYTSMIDQLLDFAHVVGDVVFGLAALPFIYVIEWWRRRFGAEPETLDTETETSSSPLSSAPEPKTRLPVGRANGAKSARIVANPVAATKPRQPLSKRTSLATMEAKHRQLKTSQTYAASIKVTDTSSTRDPPTNDNPIDGLPPVDEWREYLAFPSAYPPTPLAKTARTASATVSTSASLYPSISEEPAQQGFHQSLLLPHDDLNPSHAGDKSDEADFHGVHPRETEEITISVMDVDGDGAPNESMDRMDGYESEDEFNVTLRTPDAPLRIFTTLGPPSPQSNEISPLSLPSRSSVLTTADGASSLYTPSTESTTSSDAPILPPTIAGHKRTLQTTTSVVSMRARTSNSMARGTSVRTVRSARSPVKCAVVTQRRPPRSRQSATGRTLEKLESPEPESRDPFAAPSLDGDELATKRRRLSPPTTVQLTDPGKRRVRPISTAMKTTRVVPAPKAPARSSTARLQTKINARPTTATPREDTTGQHGPLAA